MTMTRWHPMREFVPLREVVDRLFEDSVVSPTILGDGGWAFPVDIYDKGDAFVVKASLPGVKPDQIEINATAEGVSIRGEVKQESNVKQESWLRQERRFGRFQRAFSLPVAIDPNTVEASFEDGVLTLTLPKSEAVRPKQIKVKAGGAVGAQAR